MAFSPVCLETANLSLQHLMHHPPLHPLPRPSPQNVICTKGGKSIRVCWCVQTGISFSTSLAALGMPTDALAKKREKGHLSQHWKELGIGMGMERMN